MAKTGIRVGKWNVIISIFVIFFLVLIGGQCCFAEECGVDLGSEGITCPTYVPNGGNFIWLTETGKMTIGTCDCKNGESIYGIAFANLSYPSCISCDVNDCFGFSRIVAVIEIEGDATKFKSFFPDGINFSANDGTSYSNATAVHIKEVSCKKELYLLNIDMQSYLIIDGYARRQKNSPDSGSFTVSINFYEQLTPFNCSGAYYQHLATVQDSISVGINKETADNSLSYVPDITTGPQPCYIATKVWDFSDDQWRNDYHFSWLDYQDNCHIEDDSVWLFGGTTTIYKVKTPAWEKEVKCFGNPLPDYMSSEGWYLNVNPADMYIYHYLGNLGTVYYNCGTANAGGDKSMLSSIEYCPSGIRGSGTTTYNFSYDVNDRIHYIYDSSTVGGSAKVYEYIWTPGSNGLVSLTVYYRDNGLNSDPVRSWSAVFDSKGRLVQYLGETCLSGCGSGGSDYQRYEYYNTDDYNDVRFDGLLKKQFNADGDIILWNLYDANSLKDPNYGYLSQPLLISQYAVDNPGGTPVTVKFKQFVYNASTKTVAEYRYVDNNTMRCIKSYYADTTFSNLIQKVEYKQLTTSFTEPTGTTYTTHYQFDDVNGIKTVAYPSGARKDVEKYNESGQLVESYVHDISHDANANNNQYTYSGYDLYQHTDARGGVTTYSYASDGQVLEQDDPTVNGQRQELHNSFDGAHRAYQSWTKDTNGVPVYTYYSYNGTTGRLDWQADDYGGTNETLTLYKYNDFGQIIRQKSPAGVVTGKHYNLAGQIESEFVLADANDINDADTSLVLLSQTKYEYDNDGRTKKIIKAKDSGAFTFNDPSTWIVTQYNYDFLGRKTAVIEDANGAHPLTTSYEYDNQGEVTKVTEPSGKWSKTVRDGRGLTAYTYIGYGSTTVLTTSYDYDDNGNLTQKSNPDGTVEYSNYDNFDRLEKTRKQSSDYPNIQYEYDPAGQITGEKAFDVNGVMLTDARKEYDILGRIWKTRMLELPNDANDANDMITLYQYDIAGNLIKMVRKGVGSTDGNSISEPNDIITETYYDSLNRQNQTIDGKGFSTSYTYDKDGRLLTTTDPNYFVTTNSYDAAGRLYQATDAEGHYKRFWYNSFGQVIEQIAYDCNGTPSNTNNDFAVRQERFEYNNFGRQIRQAVLKNPASTADVNTAVDMVADLVYYDANGLLYQQKKYYDGSYTATTTYGYDRIARKAQVVDPENNEQRFYYEDSSYPARLTKQEQVLYNSNGSVTVTTLFDYDSYGRLFTSTIDRTSPQSDIVTTYLYDDMGRQKSIIAADGITTDFAYNAFGNLVTKIEDVGGSGHKNRTTDYTFDRIGRQVAVIGYDPNAQTTHYFYDKNNNVTEILYPDNKNIQYIYTVLNKVDEEIKRDGSHVYYCYDNLGRITQESDAVSNPTFITTFDYDGAGNLISTAKYANGGTVSQSAFSYNGFGLKESEMTTYSGDANTAVMVTYGYDQSGNIASQSDTKTDSTLDFTHDGLGRITTIVKDSDTIATYSYIGKSTKSVQYNQAGITETSGFDDIGRLEEIASVMDSNPLLDLIYTHDDLSNRTSVLYNHLATPVYDNYAYDNLRRLTYVEYGSASGVSLIMDKLDIQYAAAIGEKWIESDATDFTALLRNRLTQIDREKKDTEKKAALRWYKKLGDNAPVVALAVLGDSNSTRTETVTDDNGNTTAEIVYDSQDRMLSFTMFLTDGGKVVVESTFDANGTNADVAKTYDANGTLLSTETIEPQQPVASSQSSQSVQSVSLESTPSARLNLGGSFGGGMMMSMSPTPPEETTETFNYDTLGNRTTSSGKHGSRTYTRNNLNQYTHLNVNYSGWIIEDSNLYYDDNSNLEVDQYGYVYDYDYRNRLIEVAEGASPVAQYTYDSLGRRIKKVADNKTTYYYYDIMGRVITEVSSGTWERSFVYGSQIDEVLAMFTPEPPEPYYYIDQNDTNWLVGFSNAWLTVDANSQYNEDSDPNINFADFAKHLYDHPWQTVFPSESPDETETQWYYLHDALGSVMGVIGGKFGREEDREYYLYDAYGQCDSTSAIGNPYFFTGKRVDAGLQDNVNRTYNYTLGRWMQIDPLGYVDGMNLYEYVKSSPTMFIDPKGTLLCKECNPDLFKEESPADGREGDWDGIRAGIHFFFGGGTDVVFRHTSTFSKYVSAYNSAQNTTVKNKIKKELREATIPPCSVMSFSGLLAGFGRDGKSSITSWLIGSDRYEGTIGSTGNDPYGSYTYTANCCVKKECCKNGQAKVKAECKIRFLLKDVYSFDRDKNSTHIGLSWGTPYWTIVHYYNDLNDEFTIPCK